MSQDVEMDAVEPYVAPPIIPRRVMRVYMTPEFLLQMMREGYRSPAGIECVQGIPMGAKVLGTSYDPVCNAVFVFVEHESFPETPPAHESPVLQVVFRQVGT